MFGLDEIKKINSDVKIKKQFKTAASELPLRQSSIDKVVDVLKVCRAINTRYLTACSELSITTVLRVIGYLESVNSVEVKYIKTGQHYYRRITYKGYEKSEESVKASEEKDRHNKGVALATDEYIAGGVTLQSLTDKYNVSLSSIHQSIVKKRGSKRKVKS